MQNQKHLVHLKAGIHYLNCAAKSPLLKAGEKAMLEAMDREKDLHLRTANDFFERPQLARQLFADLVHCKAEQVAIMPAVSYGLGTVLNNIQGRKGQHAMTIESEFPSDYLGLERWCKQHEADIKIIGRNESNSKNWNERIIEAISRDTALVVISAVHWMNGFVFDLKAIGARCKEVDALFIVDGTQAVGAMEIDVMDCGIDALICAGYKWLFGPYSLGCFYLSERFNNGKPLEESWMNRTKASDFSDLTNYSLTYTAGAGRYNMGETSNFLLMPVLIEGLKQVLEWQPARIQAYCKSLAEPLRAYSRSIGMVSKNEGHEAHHLFALSLPERIRPAEFMQTLTDRQIYVSARGTGLRVSLNVYNTPEDVQALIDAMKS